MFAMDVHNQRNMQLQIQTFLAYYDHCVTIAAVKPANATIFSRVFINGSSLRILGLKSSLQSSDVLNHYFYNAQVPKKNNSSNLIETFCKF